MGRLVHGEAGRNVARAAKALGAARAAHAAASLRVAVAREAVTLSVIAVRPSLSDTGVRKAADRRPDIARLIAARTASGQALGRAFQERKQTQRGIGLRKSRTRSLGTGAS